MSADFRFPTPADSWVRIADVLEATADWAAGRESPDEWPVFAAGAVDCWLVAVVLDKRFTDEFSYFTEELLCLPLDFYNTLTTTKTAQGQSTTDKS